MRNFAGSSITYYGLAREKLKNKYPRLISVLVILALICMTGLALFLISDLVSFASNQDHGGVLFGLNHKGPENGITSMSEGKDKSENNSMNSSRALENMSLQTKEQGFANQSKMNASLTSSQAAKGVVAISKSSSSKSSSSKHHMTKSPAPTNQSMNATNSTIADSNNLSNEGQIGVLSGQDSVNPQSSKDTGIMPTRILSFSPSASFGAIINQAKDTPAREPVSIIKFKTKETFSQKSDLSPSSDNGINSDNKVQGSRDATSTSNSQAIKTTSASLQKSKTTATIQAKKAQEARAKMKANRDKIVENLKSRAAQSRANAAAN